MGAIGFTGPRTGMTVAQRDMLVIMLGGVHRPFQTLRHGDCIACDATAAAIARSLGFWIINHPGHYTDGKPNDQRGWFPGDAIPPEQGFLARNRTIVELSTVLIATPSTLVPPKGRVSGTWFTIDYAWQVGKVAHLIFPDGSVDTRDPRPADAVTTTT